MTGGYDQPPAYPFPEDNVLFHSVLPGFTLGEDSYFAIAELPEDTVHIFDGREHRNYFRFTVHTPYRGSTSMLINNGDCESILTAMAVALSRRHDGEFRLSAKWLEIRTGIDVDLKE